MNRRDIAIIAAFVMCLVMTISGNLLAGAVYAAAGLVLFGGRS